jgi:hypothetical protein
LQIHYPAALSDSAITGQIKMYCPSDDRNDRRFTISPTLGKQTLPLSEIPAGRYKIQIDWQANQETFWNEGVVVIENNTH